MSDELDGWLRAARPDTDADDEWAESVAGRRLRTDVVRVCSTPSKASSQLRLPALLGAGLTAAAAVVVTVAAFGGGPATPSQPGGQNAFTGPRPETMTLAAFTSCDAALAGLREHAARAVTFRGFASTQSYPVSAGRAIAERGLAEPANSTAAPASAAGVHSTTNTQEVGVGEPDVVETDGRRVVSVSAGTLRVTDARTRETTGTLDLTAYAGATEAQLLMSGDRVLVLLRSITADPVYYAGPGPARYSDATSSTTSSTTSTYLLVDIAHAPTIVSTLHPRGDYVDARMVGGEVRLVVRSAPKITLPQPVAGLSSATRLGLYQDRVRTLPISAWQPSYDVSTGGRTVTRSVPCDQLRHPKSYTATTMLTVYSFGLGSGFGDGSPVTVAADATTVYASTSSLYVAAPDGAGATALHRFDINRPGRPTYLGSGRVAGSLLDAYSLSDYLGSLRVVTTAVVKGTVETGVHVLDADTLHETGSVGGLGVGEQVQAVRFLGPLAYVVTFRQVDPLYVLDLRDPAHPRSAGELQVSGYSTYLHPTDPGRLLGVGQDVRGSQVAGLQVSLFDVRNPARPARVANVVRSHSPGEAQFDPHAFLYWAPTRTAVVPIQTWSSGDNGTVLVLHVAPDGLSVRGIVRNPEGAIARSFVVGSQLWTMSSGGLAVSELNSLHRLTWIPFS